MSRRVVWVDAFTDRAMGGNPCAVVFDAADLDVGTRLAFTRETRLSECSFLVPSERADFGARYYLASREIGMAGHPTLATAAALEHAGRLEGRERFTLEVGAGILSIDVERSGPRPVFAVTFPAPQFGRIHDPARIARLGGLAPEEVLGSPGTVSVGGTAFCLTRLRDRAALDRLRPDLPALAAMRPEADFFEPFFFVTEGFTEEGDTAARLFLTPPEPAEDPFTGSATACMAAWLWRQGLIDGPRFAAEQGHAMGRPGRAMVEVLGPREAIRGVRVGGPAVVLIEGRLFL